MLQYHKGFRFILSLSEEMKRGRGKEKVKNVRCMTGGSSGTETTLGTTVPFRPTRLVIVIRGSARRFFGQCHQSLGVCHQLRSVIVFSEFGSCGGEPVTMWHRRSLAQWYYGGVSSPSGPPPGEHLSSSSGLPPLLPVLIFFNFFCHQPTPHRVGRNGTVPEVTAS